MRLHHRRGQGSSYTFTTYDFGKILKLHLPYLVIIGMQISWYNQPEPQCVNHDFC